MTLETDLDALTRLLDGVKGWLSLSEAALLCQLAQETPRGTIVEIGSYHGRSTIALAYGAYKSQSTVYAIDPHHAHEAGGYLFSPSDLAAFMENLLRSNLAAYVRVINLPSDPAMHHFESIDLAWIDGAHDYDSVAEDIGWAKMYLTPGGSMVVHDYGTWDGVTKAVNEVLDSPFWEITQQVDFTVVLKRATP